MGVFGCTAMYQGDQQDEVACIGVEAPRCIIYHREFLAISIPDNLD